jgi:molybdopterin-guanine dinucleotide biosynthesis protein A
MTSIILAGGKSSRLGRSKALQVIEEKSLIQRVVDRLAILCTEIIIVTAHGEVIPCSSTVRIKTVADIYPGKGPLVLLGCKDKNGSRYLSWQGSACWHLLRFNSLI